LGWRGVWVVYTVGSSEGWSGALPLSRGSMEPHSLVLPKATASASAAAAALPAPAKYRAGPPRAPATPAVAQPTTARLCCWAGVPLPLLATPPALALLLYLWREGPGVADRRRPALASPPLAGPPQGLGRWASRVGRAPGQGLEHNRHSGSPQNSRRSRCQCRKPSAAGQGGTAGTETRVSASISGVCWQPPAAVEMWEHPASPPGRQLAPGLPACHSHGIAGPPEECTPGTRGCQSPHLTSAQPHHCLPRRCFRRC
jgi:hypothetical protein